VAGAACEDGEEGGEGVGEEDGGEAEGCVGGDEEGGEGGCGCGWVKVVGHSGYFLGMLGGVFFSFWQLCWRCWAAGAEDTRII